MRMHLTLHHTRNGRHTRERKRKAKDEVGPLPARARRTEIRNRRRDAYMQTDAHTDTDAGTHTMRMRKCGQGKRGQRETRLFPGTSNPRAAATFMWGRACKQR